MASVSDSFRENFTEHLALLKYLILTIPVYYAYNVYTQAKGDYSYFSILAGIITFYLFGFLIKITHNVINEKIQLVPSLNPFPLALSALKGIIAIGPVCAISYYLANYILSLLSGIINMPPVFGTIQYIIWFVFATFIITSYLLFASKENILDAYNVKTLIDKSGDLILNLVFLILQIIFVNLITTVFICYVLSVLFGYGPFLTFFIVFFSVFNIGVIGHGLGQASCEVISYGNSKDKKQK